MPMLHTFAVWSSTNQPTVFKKRQLQGQPQPTVLFTDNVTRWPLFAVQSHSVSAGFHQEPTKKACAPREVTKSCLVTDLLR